MVSISDYLRGLVRKGARDHDSHVTKNKAWDKNGGKDTLLCENGE